MPEWLEKLLVISPALGGGLMMLFALYKMGVIHVGRKNGLPGGSQHTPEGDPGRSRAVQFLDLVELHELPMPEHWVMHVDERARHKAANIIGNDVMREINAIVHRVSRLEPLIVEVRDVSEAVVRLEEQRREEREGRAEIKQAIKDLHDEVRVALTERRS